MSKKRCKKKDYIEKEGATFCCKKCNRVANKKEKLCKAQKIKHKV